MTGIAKEFQEEIENSLGIPTWKKIEDRIKTKYNITIAESIADFPKFQTVLSEMFGDASKGLEKRVLDKKT